ncbi:hypothetical protein JXA88_15805, partial [Candidatus Fermentibacteria bacterium]|nr:hypothetical protein [Candidatus Fermentibacteria bacterium]
SGECNGTEGIGVVGWAGATTGGANGVFGYSASPAGAGVVGQAAATTGGPHGVYGTSAASEGRGVTGVATATTGTTYGVYGHSDSIDGYGVYGEGPERGVYGYGVHYGVYGEGPERGVYGYGYHGVCGDGYYGVIGHTTSTYGYGVYYSGGLAGTGTKSCVVKTSKGPTLMYCQESPENWFEDFGEGLLVNGRCHVELDPVFLETVTIDAANPMKVFIELEDEECAGIVVKRGFTGFDVIERQDGQSSSPFWYRVVAKRQGFEAKRLDVCEAARTDSYLYPELREKEEQEREAEDARHREDRARHDGERVRMEEQRTQMKAEQARRDEQRTRMEEERAIGSQQ